MLPVLSAIAIAFEFNHYSFIGALVAAAANLGYFWVKCRNLTGDHCVGAFFSVYVLITIPFVAYNVYMDPIFHSDQLVKLTAPLGGPDVALGFLVIYSFVQSLRYLLSSFDINPGKSVAELTKENRRLRNERNKYRNHIRKKK